MGAAPLCGPHYYFFGAVPRNLLKIDSGDYGQNRLEGKGDCPQER